MAYLGGSEPDWVIAGPKVEADLASQHLIILIETDENFLQ